MNGVPMPIRMSEIMAACEAYGTTAEVVDELIVLDQIILPALREAT
jgi:hypothetical protein